MGRSIQSSLPGCIYPRGNSKRFWWKVRLVGEPKARARPLTPPGARFATADPHVAVEIARGIWQAALFRADKPLEDEHSLAALIQAYVCHARDYYRTPEGQPSKEISNIRFALSPLADAYGTLPPEEFGPLKLKIVRQAMIEAGLARTTINQRVGAIKRMFKWAASEWRVPPSVHQGLTTVDGLRRGRSAARETEPVMPIDEQHVRTVLPYTSHVVAAMIELQLLTGMRSGELVIMRPCDVDRGDEIWLYRPARHKTSYRGLRREVPIGPRGQVLLTPFLLRPGESPCFSPAEAQRQRREDGHARRTTPLAQGNRPGTNRKAEPERAPRDRYTSQSYGQAVKYALRAARRAIRAAEPSKAGLADQEVLPHWSPHQLRHTAATLIRKNLGLDSARALLGHRSLQITDDYAELDRTLAIEAARRFG